jgi:type IX secretion system substrate protein
MKKLYTLSILLISAVTLGQSVVITTVVDGTLPSDGCAGVTGTASPKITELYVSGTMNFLNYKLQTESNGAADPSLIVWSTGLDLSPLGTVTDSFVYLVSQPSTTFNEMYPGITLPTGLSAGNIPNGNGNDSYRIVLTDGGSPAAVVSVIDQFGNPLDIPGGSGDYTAAWAYQDSYAKRVSGVGPNGGTFVNSTFTYGGNASFMTPNNNCAFISNAIGLGSFTLANQKFEIAGLKVYPNPVTNGNLFITSDTNNTKQVTVYDVLGKQVVKTTVTNQPVNVSALNSGVYIVKITEDGKTATRKLVIK